MHQSLYLNLFVFVVDLFFIFYFSHIFNCPYVPLYVFSILKQNFL